MPEEPREEPTEPSFPGAPPAESDPTKLLEEAVKGSK